jgi:hypothetical protein
MAVRHCHRLTLILLCVISLWLLDKLLSAGSSSPPSCSMAAEPLRTVAFWAEGAGPVRWVVRVLSDIELAELPLDALSADPTGLGGALGSTNLSGATLAADACVHSARTGERMRAWSRGGPRGPHRRSAVGLSESSVKGTGTGTGTLVFEPAVGPGLYEVYTDCIPAAAIYSPPMRDLTRSDGPRRRRSHAITADTAATAATATSPLVSRSQRASDASPGSRSPGARGSAAEVAAVVRAEARIALGDPWQPTSGGHRVGSGGRVYWEWERISGQGAGTVRMRSAGNQRLRVWLPASAAAAAAVRVRVAWRRPWGAVASGVVRPLLRVYRGHERVRHAVLIAAEDEEVQLLFGPALGEGEYTVYFLGFTARWDAYDAQHDRGSTRYGEHARTMC